MRPAIFFDLGWTIGHPESDAGETFILFGETVPAMKIAKNNGYIVVIVSNQKSVAEGIRTHEESERMLERVKRDLAERGVEIDGVYVCPHRDEDFCECRKPKLKMYEDAVRDLDIDVARSWVIGDLWRDVVAGHRLGARTAHAHTSFRSNDKAPDEHAGIKPDIVAKNVLDAMEAIVAKADI